MLSNKCRLYQLIALGFIASILAQGASRDDELLSRIEACLDPQRTKRTEDVEFIKAHPDEAFPILESALAHSDPVVRARSFYLLAILPRKGTPFIERMLNAEDAAFRRWALMDGLEFYPENSLVAKALVDRLAECSNLSSQGEWLVNARLVDPRVFPKREAIRSIVEDILARARPDEGIAGPYAVLMLGRFQDSRSKDVLMRLACKQSERVYRKIDYRTLPENLLVALAMQGVPGAAREVAGKLLRDEHQSRIWFLVPENSKWLCERREIQNAFLKRIRDIRPLEEQSEKALAEMRAAGGCLDYQTKEELQLDRIRTSAKLLADCWDIPKGKLDRDDILRIKREAAARLK
jgi:hypothetical protein